MLSAIKNMFGGSGSQLAMLKTMLPTIMKDALPMLKQAFDSKAKSLLMDNDVSLLNVYGKAEEVAAFVVVRNGKLSIQWAVLQHDTESGIIRVQETLEVTTPEELIQAMLAKDEEPQLQEPAQLPEVIEQPNTEDHNASFLSRYLVIKVAGKYEAIEGPAPEGYEVFFGSNSYLEAGNHAGYLNRKIATDEEG